MTSKGPDASPSRQQLSQDVTPSPRRPNVGQELRETLHISRSRLEEIQIGYRADQMPQDFETVIDEVGYGELTGDRRLLMALATEAHVVGRDASGSKEALPLQPVEEHGLERRIATRDQPDAIAEPLVAKLPDGLERALDRCRARVSPVSHGCSRPVLSDAVDDDTADIDAERLRASQGPRRGYACLIGSHSSSQN